MLKIWTGAKPDLFLRVVRPNLPLPADQFEVITGMEVPAVSPGDVLLTMGAARMKVLQSKGVVPKNQGLGLLRGHALAMAGAKLLLTYDPAVSRDDYRLLIDLLCDLKLTMRVMKTGTDKPEVGEYKYVENLDEAWDLIEADYVLFDTPVEVAIDTETIGFDPYDPKAWIVSIQVTVVPGKSWVIRFRGVNDPRQPARRMRREDGGLGFVRTMNRYLFRQIKELLTSPKVSIRGANFKFDTGWMWVHWGLRHTAFRFDTTIVGSLLDENRSNSLNTHAKLYTDMGGYDDDFNVTYDKGRMDLVPDGPFLTYAGGDTDADFQVAVALKRQLLKDPRLTRFYVELLHPASLCFERMEQVGVLIDPKYFAELAQVLEAKLEELTGKAEGMMARRLIAWAKATGTGFSLTRDALWRRYFFDPKPVGLGLTPKILTDKDKKPSVSEKHLKQFLDVPEAQVALSLIKEFNSAKKTLSTYVLGFLEHLRADGRLHPTAVLFKGDFEGDTAGTVTGRLAFRDPAMQTLPKHTVWAKPLRKGYIAPPGRVILNWDYSQGELRITACVANEPTMIKAYRAGIDMHLKTGAALNGVPLDKAQHLLLHGTPEEIEWVGELRQGGKAGNFGLIYGMMEEGYRIYAYDTYGVTLTSQQAHAQREAFFETYPGLVAWHEEYKRAARKYKRIRSPLGRIRHLPLIDSIDREVSAKAERQAINSPVQSTLSDLVQYALVVFHREYGYPKECQFFMMTHDALAAYVDEDQVDVWGPRVKEVMENLPLERFDWKPQLQFLVDWEMGPNLAEMTKMKG